MPCALCLKDDELKEEAVLPDFLYRGRYDEQRGFCVADQPLEETDSTQRLDTLLCRRCATKLSKPANYMAYVLEHGLEQAPEAKGNFVILRGMDYERIKLFQLGLLWKASVSEKPFFTKVSLGPHQEKIRKMLLEENPGASDDYGCLILRRELNQADGSVTPPLKLKFQGNNAYRFVFGGFIWTYIVSNHFDDAALKSALINPYQTGLLVEDFVKPKMASGSDRGL